MCGIAGIFHYRDRKPVDPVQLKRMADSIVHRGPDDEGFLASGPAGLAHRRLSIIDVKGGHQPMSNEDDSIWIVFNGEIYNHAELRPLLEAKGHRYKSDCDTETILHAYEEYGDACVEHLTGMFAFAIWDKPRQQLLLARDRVGIKPLYYSLDRHGLQFSSELKALLAGRSSRPALDVESLDCFLSLSYVPAPWTLFKGIVKLPTGHIMKVVDGQVSVRSYWDLRYSRKWTAPDAELKEELREVLTSAISSHLMSEVPLGVFLSGGLDSGYIVSTMTQRLGVACQTFSIGYDGDVAENELSDAAMVAKQFGAQHHEYRIGARDFMDSVPAIIRHLEEPISSPAIIPLYHLARKAREHVTVVLSGEGADEALGGYGQYRRMLLAERMHQMRGLTPAWRGFETLFGDSKAGRLFRDAARPLDQRYLGISSIFGSREREHLALRPFADRRLQRILDRYHGQTRRESPLDRMLYFDTKVYLVDDLLLKADKMTMASSMELRVPFLDHHVLEFCARLPVHLKVNGETAKVLLRRLMAESFTPDFLTRPKKGFPVPLARWFRDCLKGDLEQVLLDGGSMSRRIWTASVLERLVRKTGQETDANARKLWALYQFEQWKTTFEVQL